MSLTRKKQDEKNLKILRELLTLPHNKNCFDCNQRGPTYVNVTIGSFVCTKCSGLLRGLTPPHRVKSISMASFTQEEIDLLRTKGNEHCNRVWLALHEGPKPSERDEAGIHSLMLDKYEKKRFYMESTVPISNGVKNDNVVVEPKLKTDIKLKTNNNFLFKPLRIINGDKKNATDDFIADFDHANIFNANTSESNGQDTSQASFANFDNNPIFNNENINFSNDKFSNHMRNDQFNQEKPLTNGIAPPSEDRYAALKDLDNALKSQPTIDWNIGGSNSSQQTSLGNQYSSTPPQNYSFGSTSQDQFMAPFFPQEHTKTISNPFNNKNNNFFDAFNDNQNMNTVNPFGTSFGNNINNGNNFQTNGTSWTSNPFKSETKFSNNPFL